MTEPKRRRGKRDDDATEMDEGELVAELRRRSWAWLAPPPPPPAPAAPPPRHEAAEAMEAPHASFMATPAEPPRGLDGGDAHTPGPAGMPANDAAPLPPAPSRKRGKRAAASAAALPEAVAALRRKAWWWLQPPLAAAAAASPATEPPKRRRNKKEAAVPDPVAELRRRAWAWFAPRATGESAAGSHAPARAGAESKEFPGGEVVRAHLKGVLEAVIFASEHPLPARELARIAQADLKVVKLLLAELVAEYHTRGMRLDEVAGGFVFRTSPVFAPFVREQVAKKPVKMTRAQIETLAIVAYRQPITRPEIDEVRGVDSGAVLKSLLERDLVRILGKKDEPGRPMLYGTTPSFLEFFGLKALGDLPTLREFTELTDESKRAYERELGEEPMMGVEGGLMGGEGELRTPATEQPVDVAALEDDPTLPVKPTAEAEAAEGEAPIEPSGEGGEEESPPERGQVDERGDDETEEGEEEDEDEDEDDEDEEDEEDEDDEDEDEDEDDEDDEDEDEEDEDDEDEDDEDDEDEDEEDEDE